MASRNWILFSSLLLLTLLVWSSRAEEIDDGENDGGQGLEELDEDEEQVLDPRLLLILPTGAGNLLNVNTTAALLALLGSAALLSALGFLIYHVVSSKLMMKGQSSYGYGGSSGGYGGGSGGYSSFGGSGGSGGYGSSGSGSYGYARYPSISEVVSSLECISSVDIPIAV